MGIWDGSNTDFDKCRFALALSGGGYRATLFHLGSLRRLNEVGWINRVERLTAVSGGSLLVGFMLSQCPNALDRNVVLTDDEWQKGVSSKVHRFVKNDLRTIQTIQNLTINQFFRKRRLSNTIYRLEQLYGENRTLDEFPYSEGDYERWPEIFILATDLVNAQAFRFSNNPEMSGNGGVGLCDLSFVDLATSCAASASFPPLFGPVQLGHELKKYPETVLPPELREKLSEIALSDGGLYDNLGKNLVAGASDSLVRLFSDAGNPYSPNTSWTKDPRVMLKYMQLMSSFISRLNFQMMKMIRKNDYAFWSAQFSEIRSDTSTLGFTSDFVNTYLEKVRTDLDLFSDEEACILENHGYAQTELGLRNEFGDEYTELDLPEASWPYPIYAEERNLIDTLVSARKRKNLSQLFRLSLYK